jgi:lipid A disaccharide synthetase
LLQCPHVIVYKPNKVTEFLVRRVINYWGPIGLSNLVCGVEREPFPIPELTGSGVTAQTLSSTLVQLLLPTPLAEKLRGICEDVRHLMIIRENGKITSPSLLAAREILEVADQNQGQNQRQNQGRGRS